MKKIRVAILALFSAVLLSACSSYSISDYLPFDDNLLLTYEVEADFSMTWQIFNAHSSDSRLQRRMMVQTGQIIAEVLEVRDNQIIAVNVVEPFIQHANIIGRTPEQHLVMLSEPIEQGHSWIQNPFDPDEDAIIMEITGVDISVVTPAGAFETIEITTTQPLVEPYIVAPHIREYFAPGIGSVKQISFMGISTEMPGWDDPNFEEESITVRLIDIDRSASITDPAHIFYITDNDVPQVQITYTTNNDLAALYTEVLQQLFYIAHGDINTDLAINYAVVNFDTSLLNLDLSAAFLTEMSRAVDYEREQHLLNVVAATFGFLYAAEDVRITVDGNVYSGTFITMGHNESIRTGQGIWN